MSTKLRTTSRHAIPAIVALICATAHAVPALASDAAVNAPPRDATNAPEGFVFLLVEPQPDVVLVPIEVAPTFLFPTGVGANVAKQVADIRGPLVRLVDAFRERGREIGLRDWNRQAAELDRLTRTLRETRLDYDAGTRTSARDWNIVADDTLGAMGSVLASLHDFAARNASQFRNMHNTIVDQVDDVREAMGDLVGALRKDGVGYGLPNWETRVASLEKSSARLDAIQTRLMDPGEAFDEATASAVTKSLGELAVEMANLRVVLMVRVP